MDFLLPTGHYNGMRVAYKSDDQDWTTVLSYQISAESGATVDINHGWKLFMREWVRPFS